MNFSQVVKVDNLAENMELMVFVRTAVSSGPVVLLEPSPPSVCINPVTLFRQCTNYKEM